MQFILDLQAQADARQAQADARQAQADVRYEKMDRTMQFILDQQADAESKRAEAEARADRIEKTMQFMLEQQARADAKLDKTDVKLDKIDNRLAVLTADVDARFVETDKLHEDILLLSQAAIAHRAELESLEKIVISHESSIQSLGLFVDKVVERIDKLAEIVNLTRNNGHNGRA